MLGLITVRLLWLIDLDDLVFYYLTILYDNNDVYTRHPPVIS